MIFVFSSRLNHFCNSTSWVGSCCHPLALSLVGLIQSILIIDEAKWDLVSNNIISISNMLKAIMIRKRLSIFESSSYLSSIFHKISCRIFLIWVYGFSAPYVAIIYIPKSGPFIIYKQ